MPSKKGKRGLVALIVIVIIAAAGGGLYLFFSPTADLGSLVSGVTTGDFRKQNEIVCEPHDEHQWYRTDSTFVVNPQDPNTMYVNVEYKGFYKSVDGGKTWEKKVNGIFTDGVDAETGENCYTEYPIAVIDPVNPDRLLLATAGSPGTLKDLNSMGGGIYETVDGGENWSQKITDTMNAYATPSLVLDPNDPNTYYYGTSAAPASYNEADQTKIFVTDGIIYRTTDNGANWEELPTGFVPNARLSRIILDADNSEKITATSVAFDRNPNGPNRLSATQMGVIQSVDGGANWKRIDNLPTGYDASLHTAYAEQNADNVYFVPAVSEDVTPKNFYSTDGGVTFSESSRYMDLVAYSPFDASGNELVGYAWQGVNGPLERALYRSVDAGKTWVSFGTLPNEIENIMAQETRVQHISWHPTDPSTFFLNGAGGHIWKTTDNGITWEKLLDYTQL